MFEFLCFLPQWAFIAVIWEFVFRAIAAALHGKMTKVDFLKLLWGFTGAVVFISRQGSWLAGILAMVPVAFVQIHLAQGSDGPTTAGQVKGYLVGVWKRFCAKCDDEEDKGG